MRVDSLALDAAVSSSTVEDRLEVSAWRDGDLLAEDLQVLAWSIPWDAGQQVQGHLSITVTDPEGVLAPYAMGDTLAPGGSRLLVNWITGTGDDQVTVPLGWWRIRTADPHEQWLLYPALGRYNPSGGGQVALTADEETQSAVMDRMDAEKVVEATSLAEVERLLDGIMPVVVDDTVTDVAVSSTLVYETARMDAVEDHLTRCDARYRMGPGGELHVIPLAGVGPVWTLAGSDDGVLVTSGRSMSDEGFYNAAVSSSQNPGDGSQVVGRSYLDDGPLAWGGPFGRVPIFHQSIATTQKGVNLDARTTLEDRVRGGEIELSITCLSHPGLQLGDLVTVFPPSIVPGASLVGRVTSMTLSGGNGVMAKSMPLTVAVPREDMASFARAIKRARR